VLAVPPNPVAGVVIAIGYTVARRMPFAEMAAV